MQAAVVTKYGPPEIVRVTEIATPTPRADEVLVRVVAAAVTSGDARIRAARFPSGFGFPARLAFGLTKPRRAVLGSVFSGTVEAVGERVSRFAPGDAVCGMAGTRMGAHAGFIAVSSKRLASVPAEVSHDDAAGVLFGGTTALHFLRTADVQAGSTLLINGASGAVGSNAVQLAVHFGATVTAVTSSANAALATSLGAAAVIDYATTDLTAISERFDVVLDTVGNLSTASGRRLLSPGGTLALAVAGLGEMLRARGNVVAGSAPERVADFEFLLEMVADGALTVVHDLPFALADIVDAYRRVDSGHKRGNIIVHP